MTTLDSIEKRLQELREAYQTASSGKREILKRQARALQIAKEKLEKKWARPII